MKLWEREPAMIVGLVETAIILAIAFGVTVTTEQLAAIVAFMTVLAAFITRQNVYSPASIEDEIVFEADDLFE